MADNTGNESEHKVWLLSWNPDNWNWDGKYSELALNANLVKNVQKLGNVRVNSLKLMMKYFL